MRRLLLAAAAVAAMCGTGWADPHIDAKCKHMIAAIKKDTNVDGIGIPQVKDTLTEVPINLNIRGAEETGISCYGGKPSPLLTAIWPNEGRKPPVWWYNFVDRVGAIIAESSPDDIEAAVSACQEKLAEKTMADHDGASYDDGAPSFTELVNIRGVSLLCMGSNYSRGMGLLISKSDTP